MRYHGWSQDIITELGSTRLPAIGDVGIHSVIYYNDALTLCVTKSVTFHML